MSIILKSKIISLRGHHICLDLLSSQSIVVDLGANTGEFSTALSALVGCRCHAVEPSIKNFQKIRETMQIHKYCLAIGRSDGDKMLYISKNPEANRLALISGEDIVGEQSVPCMRLETFLKKNSIPQVDLLKVDIEGAEMDLLESLSDEALLQIQQLTIEFHDFIPEFNCRDKVREVIRRMERIGFYCINFSLRHHVDVLFINKAKANKSNHELFYMKHIFRSILWFKKIMRKISYGRQ